MDHTAVLIFYFFFFFFFFFLQERERLMDKGTIGGGL